MALAFLLNLIKSPAKLYNGKAKALIEAEPVIGKTGSVTRHAVMICAQIREFIRDFSIQHGPLPIPIPTPDAAIKLQMDRDQMAWCYKFTAAFRIKLTTPIEIVLVRLDANGQRDFKASLLLQKAPLSPNDALNLAALI